MPMTITGFVCDPSHCIPSSPLIPSSPMFFPYACGALGPGGIPGPAHMPWPSTASFPACPVPWQIASVCRIVCHAQGERLNFCSFLKIKASPPIPQFSASPSHTCLSLANDCSYFWVPTSNFLLSRMKLWNWLPLKNQNIYYCRHTSMTIPI